MAFDNSLPDYILPEALSDIVLLGPRTRQVVNDTVNISLAAGTTIFGAMETGIAPSVPAFAAPGPNIQLGPDEALIIEEFSFSITAFDASGSLQVNNLSASDNFGPMPLSALLNSLPYKFAPVSFDAISWSVPKTARGWYIRASADSPGNLLVQLSTQYVLQNLDPNAAHVYRRIINLVYRRVQGLHPLVPKVFELGF